MKKKLGRKYYIVTYDNIYAYLFDTKKKAEKEVEELKKQGHNPVIKVGYKHED